LAERKPEESFKVIDRRPFTAEGELRKEALEQERREEEAAATAQKTPAGKGGAAATPAPRSPAAETPKASRGFQLLVDFLARNAAVLLGGYTDPRSGEALLDLEGARDVIDMLDALREKTQGNLAPDDDRLLLDVLGSLKLSFLEMSKAAAAQVAQGKAKAKS